MTEETLLPGQGGGQYRILSAHPIDHGSTSQLFLGEQVIPDDQAGRKVAVKMALGGREKPFFAKEAEVLSLLWDMVPGAVPELYDANLEAERPYLVMEYLDTVRSLADLAQASPEGYLPEKEAVYWATRYAEILGALHDVEFTAPDRKLGDLLLVEPGNSASQAGQKRPRLVVVDWGGVTTLTPSLAAFDLLLFAQFWYALMLGGNALPSVGLGAHRPEHHRRWPELSYGAQKILSRGLSRLAQRRYRAIPELLNDWRELAALWSQSPEDMEHTFDQARNEKAYEKALKCLDIIRLVDPPRWRRRQSEAEALLNEIDTANVLVRQIKEAIKRGETLTDLNIREPLTRGATACGDDPEWQLRAQRWKILAEFSGNLPDEAHQVFREEVVEAWVQAVEALEREQWGEALDLFWQPFLHLVSPNQEHPELEEKILQARELLHNGQRIEAQKHIKTSLEASPPHEPTLSEAAVSILSNAFLPHYSQWGGIQSLLIEAELRHHMLELTANLARGRHKEIYALSKTVRSLQRQLAYQPLLEEAGAAWSSQTLKRLDQQLNLCEKADEALAESARLADQGKFQQARWILETTERDFDFSTPARIDSPQPITMEADSMVREKRRQVETERKRVLNLMRLDQVLEQDAHSNDVSQILAALEAAAEAQNNTYLKQRTTRMMEQVRRMLQSGPVLATLRTRLEEKGANAAGGDVA
ncbi:MAG: hypothetical protein Kow0063_16080 [Anaerolineae bacterium]